MFTHNLSFVQAMVLKTDENVITADTRR